MESDRGKVFVGGIPWETTEEGLKAYFGAYGEVSDAVIVKDRLTGRARGFGFVVFADPSVADLVLADKHTIDGRPVEARKVVPREEQQNLGRGGSGGGNQPSLGGQVRTKKIFVGGLASTVTEEDFRHYFEQFGNITDVVVMYDHSTQRHRGFGFITFDSEDAVEKVLQKNIHELKEKAVEVKRAIPKDQIGVPSGRGPPNNYGSGGGRGGYAPNYGPNRQGGGGGGGGYGGPAPSMGGGGGAPPPSYGPSGGYGANVSGYPPAMNAGYGGPGYGGPNYGAMAPPYGATGGVGPASGGYGNAPTNGPRSPWGSNVGTAPPAATYGANVAPGGYGGGPVQQTNPNSSGVGYGYSSGEQQPSNGSNPTGYGPQGGGGGGYGVAPSGGYVDNYGGSAAYGGQNGYNSPATAGPTSGYAADGSGNGPPANYGNYGNAGKQTQRGPDHRFHPYPAAT